MAVVASAPVEVNAIVLQRDDGRVHLDVVAARTVRSLDDEGSRQIALREFGVAVLVVTSDDLGAQPRADNTRLVWSYRGRRVHIGLRIRILQTLRDDGPMKLARLLESVRSNGDPSEAVVALACDDLLELDLKSRPLGRGSPNPRYR
jgi:hypothetical protein